MTNHVGIVASLKINDGKLEDLKALAREMSEAAQAEPGTLVYEWYVSADGTRCDIHERYADNAAFLAHASGVGPFMQRLMTMVTPSATALYGKPDEKSKAMVAGFGAIPMTQVAGFSR